MAAIHGNLSIPYRQEIKNSSKAVNIRQQLGEDLDAVGGSRRIYRSDDGRGRLTASNNKCLVFEQTDATNNPIAVQILQSATNRALDIQQTANSQAIYIDSSATQPSMTIAHSGVLDQTGGGVIDIIHSGAGTAMTIDRQTNGCGLHICASNNYISGGGLPGFDSSDELLNPVCLALEFNGAGVRQTIMGISLNTAGPCVGGWVKNTSVNGDIMLRLNNRYLWVDATGDLRISGSDAFVANDTGGVVVGSQS